jgi:nicotinate-nucleotide pyrophosphorylase (carboxylating)
MDERARAELKRLVRVALAEDVGPGDRTTQALVSSDSRAAGAVVARERLVVSGLTAAAEVFRTASDAICARLTVAEGVWVEVGQGVLEVSGPAAALLTAERTALNLVQHLSGVATLTRAYVEAVAGTGAVILDTRKTLPGLRYLQKEAVAHGGGQNHRFGLFDAILIKDNHLAALAGVLPEPVSDAVRLLRERCPGWPVEIEADTLEQVREALACGVDTVLLDNMTLEDLRAAVRLASGRAKTEASGGVTLATVRAIAETGVDYISVGALTHSARAMDLGLDWRCAV